MSAEIIITDREGKIQDISNQAFWEAIYKVPPGTVATGRNIKGILFELEHFKEKEVRDAFDKGLELLLNSEKQLLTCEIGNASVKISYLPETKQFCYAAESANSLHPEGIIDDIEHAHSLTFGPANNVGVYLEGILDKANEFCEQKPQSFNPAEVKEAFERIRDVAELAIQENSLGGFHKLNARVMQKLEYKKFEMRPESILLGKDMIEPVVAAFANSYGERRISINFKESLDTESSDKDVRLTVDRVGLRFIITSFFSIPVVISKTHKFKKFSVSYGYETEGGMHKIIYWTQWPVALPDKQEVDKILNTSEYATLEDLATGDEVPQVGLKYSRLLALMHGGDIIIEHRPYENPPAMEFRLYLPIDLKPIKKNH